MKKLSLGAGWMVVAAFFFACMGVLVKLAGSYGYASHELVFWRAIFGFVVLWIMARWRGVTLKTIHFKAHFIRSLAGTLGLLAFFYGIAHLPLATAITLNYTSALFMALISVVVLRERVGASTLFALMMGFVGVILILRPALVEGGLWLGLIGLTSGLFSAWAYLQIRVLTQLQEPSVRVVFYFTVISGAASAFISTLSGWHAVKLDTLPLLIGIGACATIAQVALTRAYQVGRKFVVATLSYLTVVFSTVAGVLLFGETVGLSDIIGIAVIIFVGVYGSLRR